MSNADLKFWNDSAKSWAEMVIASCTFIRQDIDDGRHSAALAQIEVIRQKLAHMSESIKNAREVYNDQARKDF